MEIRETAPGMSAVLKVRFKTLRSITGFLGYVGMTYSMMVPYFKGLHLTLNSWRPNRDTEGWKTKRDQWTGDHGDPPEFVGPVPRLESDVKALLALTRFDQPPKIPVRALHSDPLFIVGDGLGPGFGVSVWRQGSKVIRVRHGAWSTEVSTQASSNFQEAANLAMELRWLVTAGQIAPGTEVWVFTDNSCAEKTFYNGSSTLPLLHEMVLELRKLEMEGSLIIRYVWIAGDRMIAQGTDGHSRGDFTSGVMAGENFLKFIPLDETAIAREPTLCDDLQSWSDQGWRLAKPEDWFYETRVQHDIGTPGQSVDSQAWINGNVICLLCSKEIKKLSGVVCANYGVRWHQGTCCNGAWHGACFKQGPRDRFLVLDVGDLDDAVLAPEECGEDDPGRFKEAREGDHLMTPFQCVKCHFVNIKGRFPQAGDHKDSLAVTAILRATLDSFWPRERSTVNSNRIEGVRYLKELSDIGFQETAYPPRGPLPKEDLWGMGVACAMLGRSMASGHNSLFVQFETVRKLRGHYSNMVHTTADLVSEGGPYSVGPSHELFCSKAATNSLWFKRFMIGCHRRMGDVWMPDLPLTAPILRQCLITLDTHWVGFARDTVGRWKTALTACMLLAGYFGALRGEEIVRVDLGLILRHWEEAASHETPHVPLLLKGRFKHVDGEKIFCQPLAMKTQAGLDIGSWFQRVLRIYIDKGIETGPFFRDTKGKRADVPELDSWFKSILKSVQDRQPGLFRDDSELDRFSIRRSARRGATAEAQNSGIPEEVIVANNRWRKQFRSKGLNPRMSMLERYTVLKFRINPNPNRAWENLRIIH